jgi:hypothetical protein
MWPFKKKQKTISVNEFLERVKEIAAMKGKTYCDVRVSLCTNPSSLDEIFGSYVVFQCYVDGYTWYKGKTVEECLAKLEYAMFKTPTVVTPQIEINK